MHGAHFGLPVPRAQPRAGRGAELGEERVQHPGVVARECSEDVQIHLLEQMQWREDVVMKRKRQMSRRRELGRRDGMRVRHFRQHEITPEIFCLRQIERVDILGFGESNDSREEEHVEGVGSCRGGRIFGNDVKV